MYESIMAFESYSWIDHMIDIVALIAAFGFGLCMYYCTKPLVEIVWKWISKL